MGTLIALGGGIEGVPILSKAKSMGHRLVVVDGNPAAPGFALADVSVVASCYDAAATVRALRAPGLPAWRPDGILCAAVDAPHVAAAVSHAYGLPGLTPERAALSVDKVKQKSAMRSGMMIADVPDFWNVARVVVKPTNSRGARGVKLIETGGMVEQYLDGPQFSTESLVQDGRVLFTAVGLRNYDRPDLLPHVIENGFDSPYSLPEVDRLIRNACYNLNWYQVGGGVVKGDLVLHDGKLKIIELAARLSGGFFCMAHEWVYGVDFIGAAIRLALGEGLDVPVVEPGAAVCQRYLFPLPADIGRTVSHIEPVTLNVEHHTFAIRPGDVIRPVTDHGARLGQAIATGSTPEQARQRAEAAVSSMQAAVVLA